MSLLLVALLLSAQEPVPPVPVFGARTERVRVDVAVSGRGESEPDLTAGDFEVRDDGARRDAHLAGRGDEPIHAMLVLDASSSVAGARLEHLKEAAKATLAALRPGDRATLLGFRYDVRLLSGVADDPQRVAAAVDGIVAGGYSALRDAAAAALALADPVRGRTLVILFSDGFDSLSALPPEPLLEMARGSEAVLHAVALESGTAPPFLEALAEETGGRMWPAESPQRLREAFLDALGEFRHRYMLEFEPAGKPGWHRLEVKVKGARVLARKGYFLAAP